jgi:hypothetical protein
MEAQAAALRDAGRAKVQGNFSGFHLLPEWSLYLRHGKRQKKKV